MAQYDFGVLDPYVVDGVQLADALNDWRDAMYSMQRGSSRPAFVVPGQMWINDAAGSTNWIINFYVSPSLGDVALYYANMTTGVLTLGVSPPPPDLSGYMPKIGGIFTGAIQVPAVSTPTNDETVATTRFVKDLAYAPLASPALTGNPTAPTATAGDSDTSIATTAFVAAAVAAAIASAGFKTGDGKLTWDDTAPTGWIKIDDGSIGDGSSSATTRANADTAALFTLLWTKMSNTICPVSGGRGGSAAADFAAHKRLTIPLTLGRAIAVSGAGSGLTVRTLGSVFGEEGHTLTSSEQASMSGNVTINTSGVSNPGLGYFNGSSYSPLVLTAVDGGVGTGSPAPVPELKSNFTGGGNPHNNVQPSSFWNVMVKL